MARSELDPRRLGWRRTGGPLLATGVKGPLRRPAAALDPRLPFSGTHTEPRSPDFWTVQGLTSPEVLLKEARRRRRRRWIAATVSAAVIGVAAGRRCHHDADTRTQTFHGASGRHTAGGGFSTLPCDTGRRHSYAGRKNGHLGRRDPDLQGHEFAGLHALGSWCGRHRRSSSRRRRQEACLLDARRGLSPLRATGR